MIDLDDLLTTMVDERTKGFPGGIGAMALGDIGTLGWNLLREDVPLPALGGRLFRPRLTRSARAHRVKEWESAVALLLRA